MPHREPHVDHKPHTGHQPHLDMDLTQPMSRQRADGSRWDTATIAAAPDQGRGWTESAHLIARLCVVVFLGATGTGLALAWTARMHSVARPAAVADAPDAGYPDPSWGQPIPTEPASTAKPKPTPTSTAPVRKATIRKIVARKVTTQKPVTSTAPQAEPATTATPKLAPAPTLLGPADDSTLEATLTAYCAHVRGRRAVAVLGDSADGWNCLHADRTTALEVGAACRWHFGQDAWSRTLNDDNPYSWRCFRD